MPIYLLRHAESEFNVNRESKVKNCSITENGIEQCKKLKSDVKFDLVLCSTLKRTRQTLKYSNLDYDKVEYIELIREHKNNLCDFYEDEEENYEDDRELKMRVDRIKKMLKKYNDKYNDKNILVVSHADIIWYLTSSVVGKIRFGSWFENCQLEEYDLEYLNIT